MRKLRTEPLKFVVFPIVVVLLLFSCFYKINNDNPNYASEEQTKERISPGEAHKAATDDALALYTFWLTVCTALLAVSTVGLWATTRSGMRDQARDMQESLRLAKQGADATVVAAKAAERQSTASINVELPRLFLSKIDLDEFAVNDKFITPRVAIWMTNYGRSPAFLVKECADLWIGALPEIPPYDNIITLPQDAIIKPGQHHAMDKARFQELVLEEHQARAIEQGRAPLWAFGFIEYRDFLNEPHVARFCKCLVDPRMTGDRLRWYDGPVAVPKAYTDSS